ncbi:uncharacterized protein JCM6883_004944 [Sporobolomyces salmoneus]|uniref:uncharacterized protein n=1 Tax=Sporobolomyces salmoneus TaxID=183962 RepID=UPI00317177BF
MTSALGPYSTSSALSTTHYKLVEALERARSPSKHDSILDTCLLKFKDKWSRSSPKPSQAYKDLVLILYCHSHRLEARDERLEKQEWVLLNAVRLAGSIGVGTIRQRQLGYRACIELFPVESSDGSHPLKLLLINTIRSDLYAEEYDAKLSIQRWKLALRAIASENLVTAELVAAVEERLFELLLRNEEDSSQGIRTLALEALASLIKVTKNGSSNLLNRTRDTVRQLLLATLPISPSDDTSDAVSSTSSSRRQLDFRSFASSSLLLPSPARSPRQRLRSDLTTPAPLLASFHLALMSHLSPSSTLHPISPSRNERLRFTIPLLDKYVDQITERNERSDMNMSRSRLGSGNEKRSNATGKSFAIGLERFLRIRGKMFVHGRRTSLHSSETGSGNVMDKEEETRVEEEIKARLQVLLVNVLKDRTLILSLVRTMSTITDSHFAPAILSPILSYLHESLLSSSDPNTRLSTLKILSLLPVDSWTGVEHPSSGVAGGKGKGKAIEPAGWGEESWRIILNGLRVRDENLRKTTIELLASVDRSILSLHYNQLLSTLEPTQTIQQQSNIILRLLELLPHIPSPSTGSTGAPRHPSTHPRLPSPEQLVDLLQSPNLDLDATSVIPDLVLKVLNDFRYHLSPDERTKFARALWETSKRGGSSWRNNLMLGLLLAGIVHSVVIDAEEIEGLEMAKELSQWHVDDKVDPQLKAMLSEPFLFALLRITSLSLRLPTSQVQVSTAISEIRDTLSLLSSTATPPHYLDDQLLATALRALETDENLEQLRAIGLSTKDDSLADFGQALSRGFEPNTQSSHHAATSVRERRVSYASTSDISATSTHQQNDDQDDRIEEISRSIAALKREQADLRRERQDRAGTTTAAKKGKIESLMGEDESGGKGIFSVGEEPEQEAIEERERETTFSTDGNAGDEPPGDLLIELSETLDPFHLH